MPIGRLGEQPLSVLPRPLRSGLLFSPSISCRCPLALQLTVLRSRHQKSEGELANAVAALQELEADYDALSAKHDAQRASGEAAAREYNERVRCHLLLLLLVATAAAAVVGGAGAVAAAVDC